MLKLTIVFITLAALSSCAIPYKKFVDENGRRHCQDQRSGKFVNMEKCY